MRNLPLYSWANGSFIMIVVFGLVILALVGAVLIMMNSQFLTSCSADAIQKAAEQLIAGHLVAFPTETVYGLGADATSEEACAKIYQLKGRPSNNPLIVHVSTIEAARAISS